MTEKQQSRLLPQELQQLFQYAMVLCQQADNAQDLLQSAVEHYLIELRRGKSINNKMAYLRSTIRNRFIDSFRHQQRWPNESFEEQQDYDISPVDLEQLHIDQQILQQVWQTLAPQDRDILYHWAVLGHSTDEACDILNMPRGSFLSRIHRLRKRCEQLQQSINEPQTINNQQPYGGKGE
ncbi:RNA polymerase sigma factor [Bacterioplanoides sp.]|uniref:RNA polymerase sigma factor n=1 Tax=Bacterioplanoides sp. TaxID=2066072 RepID=UPI003B5A3E95